MNPLRASIAFLVATLVLLGLAVMNWQRQDDAPASRSAAGVVVTDTPATTTAPTPTSVYVLPDACSEGASNLIMGTTLLLSADELLALGQSTPLARAVNLNSDTVLYLAEHCRDLCPEFDSWLAEFAEPASAGIEAYELAVSGSRLSSVQIASASAQITNLSNRRAACDPHR